MLLGLAYKQQDDTRTIEATLREHSSKLDEHTIKLNNLEQKIDKRTEAINENTKLMSNILAQLNKLSNG